MIHSYIFIRSIQEDLNKHRDLRYQTIKNVFYQELQSLINEFFILWPPDRCNANKVFFVDSGGLDILHNLHVELLKQPWYNSPFEMQHLEHVILQVYWNLTSNFIIQYIRLLVLRHSTTLDCIIQSYLRVKITPVKAPRNNSATGIRPKVIQNNIAIDVVYQALGVLIQ